MNNDTNATGAASEAISPSDAASAVSPAAPGAREMPLDHEHFFFVRAVDWLLNVLKTALTDSTVSHSSRWLALFGMWALLAFAALALIFGLIEAIHESMFSPFGVGIGVALVALALLYTAGKFCNAGDTIINSTPSELSSQSFLDCMALIAAVLAIVSLVLGIVVGVQEGSMAPVGVGFLSATWWAYLAAVALNPSLVNLSVRFGATAGQECLGIVSFLLKAKLRVVPIVFGVAVVVGTALFAVGMIRYLAVESWDRFDIAIEMAGLTVFLLISAALPFAVYLAVVLMYLLVDLARSILRIPESPTETR